MLKFGIIWFKTSQTSRRRHIQHLVYVIPDDVKYVLDGGALLHRVLWGVGEKYKDIVARYVNYVLKHYGKASVIFDGYGKPSIKDHAHIHRRTKTSATVKFNENMTAPTVTGFLQNDSNKSRFIDMLGRALEEEGCNVKYAETDADTLIVSEAVTLGTERNVVLVGNDTDLLVLMLHHWNNTTTSAHMIMQNGKTTHILDIAETQRQLDQDVLNHVLFAHALGGCDSTSRLFGIGKLTPVRKLKALAFKECAEVFKANSTEEDVAKAGQDAIAILYGAQNAINLDELRHKRFTEKVATSRGAPVLVKSLPPTAAAARQHALRAYLQVQQWLGRNLKPTRWGWRDNGKRLVPVHTELPPAPTTLLRGVRCKCSSGCGMGAKCTCRRFGLECTSACTVCSGIHCKNSNKVPEDDDDPDH